MSDDHELIRRFANGEEEAFSQLIQRHINFVYSAALRQVNDRHLAEDITQEVFINLAQKAKSLPTDVFIPGWLHADTRFAALQSLRSKNRREARESFYMEDKETEVWNDIRPIIDEALAELEPVDRQAVILRYFFDCDFPEVGSSLKVSPDAARMRVSRALENLRGILESRGIKSSIAALSSALLAHAVQAAPPALIAATLKQISPSTLRVPPSNQPLLRMVAKTGAVFLGFIMMTIWVATKYKNADRTAPSLALQEEETATTRSNPPSIVQSSPASMVLGSNMQLRLKVVESGTARSLEAVKVRVNASSDGHWFPAQEHQTDENGSVTVSFPTGYKDQFYHRILLEKNGFIPRFVSWSTYQNDEINDIPEEYTATLEEGSQIGGFVFDPENKPINGVEVVFSGPSPAGVDPRERNTIMGSYHTELTDQNGQWRCNHAPADIRSHTFQLNHPFFRTVTYGCTETDRPSKGPILLSEQDFHSSKAVLRMEHGMVVAGVIVDEKGLPIPSAKITKDRDWNRKQAERIADMNGRFEFNDVAPGTLLLTVEAAGFAPVTKEIQFNEDLRNTSISLTRSPGLQVRVTNMEGNPVPNVRLSLPKDERHRPLFSWSAATDQEGKVFWASSPNEKVMLNISGPGIPASSHAVEPGNQEQNITLNQNGSTKAGSIAIKVIDSETRQIIEDAQVFVQEIRNGAVFDFQSIGSGKEGVFRYKALDSETLHEFEARAAGYMPARLKRMQLQGHEEIELALKGADSIIGVVMGPQGGRILGAEVALCTRNKGALLGKKQFVFTEHSLVVKTDANGIFTHSPQVGAHTIYVVASEGFAKVNFDGWVNGNAIILQPWGTIQGSAKINGEVAANMELGLFTPASNGNERGLTLHSFHSSTDETGNFSFQGVPPIELKLAWMVPTGTQSKLYSHALPMQVKPAIPTVVDFHLSGVTIKGRLLHDSGKELSSAIDVEAQFVVKMEKPNIKRTGVQEERLLASKRFWDSEEGRAWTRRNNSYGVQVDKKGAFRVIAVPPGDYILRVSLREKIANSPFDGKITGLLEKPITVVDPKGEMDLAELIIPGTK